MLQKEQSAFEDFVWYSEWVEIAKKDFFLQWLGDTRTDFVHRQSLEPNSWLELKCFNNTSEFHDEEPMQLKGMNYSKVVQKYTIGLMSWSTARTNYWVRLCLNTNPKVRGVGCLVWRIYPNTGLCEQVLKMESSFGRTSHRVYTSMEPRPANQLLQPP
jgi:hypothetical protein